jgi:hypothetical protein
MIQTKLQWNGDAMHEKLVGAAWEGIQRATEFLYDHLRDPVLNVPNSGVKKKRTRDTSRGKKGSTYTIYPDPSQPGEPPRLRTGWLRNHVGRVYDKAELKSRVGLKAGAFYGLVLELGTTNLFGKGIHMQARPWLLASVKKFWAQLSALITA